jgi:hypothetical protein
MRLLKSFILDIMALLSFFRESISFFIFSASGLCASFIMSFKERLCSPLFATVLVICALLEPPLPSASLLSCCAWMLLSSQSPI